MNKLSKIEMANLVLNEEKKNELRNLLCTFYGVKQVNYSELSYGICIDITGSDNTSSFRFIKNAIKDVLNVKEDTISVLSESESQMTAKYVYLPEKDRVLIKKLKLSNSK
jgi:hypothetical protein